MGVGGEMGCLGEAGGVWKGLLGRESFIKSGHVLGPDVCPDLMNEFGPSWPLVWFMGGGEGRQYLAGALGRWLGFGQACSGQIHPSNLARLWAQICAQSR